MLDIAVGLNELKHVLEIHIVALNNEAKELLWMLEEGFTGSPKVKTINFTKNTTSTFEFNSSDVAITTYDSPKKYLYEPMLLL